MELRSYCTVKKWLQYAWKLFAEEKKLELLLLKEGRKHAKDTMAALAKQYLWWPLVDHVLNSIWKDSNFVKRTESCLLKQNNIHGIFKYTLELIRLCKILKGNCLNSLWTPYKFDRWIWHSDIINPKNTLPVWGGCDFWLWLFPMCTFFSLFQRAFSTWIFLDIMFATDVFTYDMIGWDEYKISSWAYFFLFYKKWTGSTNNLNLNKNSLTSEK